MRRTWQQEIEQRVREIHGWDALVSLSADANSLITDVRVRDLEGRKFYYRIPDMAMILNITGNDLDHILLAPSRG